MRMNKFVIDVICCGFVSVDGAVLPRILIASSQHQWLVSCSEQQWLRDLLASGR